MQRVVDTWNVPMDKSEPAANKKPYADPVIPTGVQPPLVTSLINPYYLLLRATSNLFFSFIPFACQC